MAVIGGFRNCGNLDDAKVWINAKCVEYGVGSAVEIWCPKAGFKGIAFAKFADISTRDKFVSKVQSTKPQYESIPVWSRAEASVEVRVCEKFLSGLEKLLVGWGFDPSRIHYDTESADKTLKVDNATKVTVSVREGTLYCDWEQSWKERVSFFSSPEVRDLLKTCGDMVAGTGKGKGKGKSNFE